MMDAEVKSAFFWVRGVAAMQLYAFDLEFLDSKVAEDVIKQFQRFRGKVARFGLRRGNPKFVRVMVRAENEEMARARLRWVVTCVKCFYPYDDKYGTARLEYRDSDELWNPVAVLDKATDQLLAEAREHPGEHLGPEVG